MSLSSAALDAFAEVARSGSFSSAARALLLTQSAVSQRVLNLERELGTSLLVRESSGLRLTAAGETLLRYCHSRAAMETEALVGVRAQKNSELSGTVRLAAYSSVLRSAVLPSLEKLVRENSSLGLEIRAAELRDLPKLLKSGEVDYIVLDREESSGGLVAKPLGFEENVLVVGKRFQSKVPERYLDHDSEDTTTEGFFRLQDASKRPKKLERLFLDDVYGILDATRAGLGRAVLSKHLVANDKDFGVVPGFKSLKRPVVLHFYEQPFYTRLHAAVVSALEAGMARHLEGKS